MTTTDCLPTGAACRFLERSTNWLGRAAEEGRIKAIWTPLGRLWRRADLEALKAEADARRTAQRDRCAGGVR